MVWLAPLGVAAGGAGAWWLFRRPQRALLLLAALVPFDGLLLLVPHPGVLDGWKEALVLGAVAGAVVFGERRDAPRPPLPAWVLPLGGLVALAGASAAIVGASAIVGLKVAFFYALVPVVLWRCPFTARDRDRLVGVFMVTAVITSAVGVAQQLLGAERLVAFGYEYDTTVRFAGDQLRSFSTFNQPFPFAFYVVAVSLVAVPVALADCDRWRNRLFLASTPLLVVGVLTTVVRAALLAALIGGLWLLVRRRRALARVIVPALAFFVLVVGAAGGSFRSADSLRERFDAWRLAATQVADAPFGAGIGASGAAAEKSGAELTVGSESAQDPARRDAAIQADNYYVKVLIELGPIGVWLFAAFLVLTVREGRTLATARAAVDGAQFDAALADGITAATVAAVAAATVSSYWEIFPVDVVFWLLQGVLLSQRLLAPGSSATPSPCDLAAAAPPPTSGRSCEDFARRQTWTWWPSCSRTPSVPCPSG
jgi:hypothetical protein